jgi:nucleoside 2-deoxyribosyltransferase
MYSAKGIELGNLYYLASPYSHVSPVVRQLRYEIVNAFAAHLIQQGYHVLEPIVSCHNKALLYRLPIGYDYWRQRDRKLIDRSDGVIVVTMPGWKTSQGVQDEITYASRTKKPVYFLDPEDSISKEIWDALHQ